MTFKHIKFEDSVVMRSLEKLANEKGLVKKDTLAKQAAAAKPSKPASDSLVEKVIFLCSQLRAAKFEKHAQELESKLMAYKKANTLYETSSEKGEDLVQQAHPKGSHKLQGIDSSELAIIETIVDQQLKNIKMIDKKPTGKLANHEIIKAVKFALAESKDEIWSQLMNRVSFVKSRVSQVYEALGVPYHIGNAVLDKLNDPTVDNIKAAQKGFVMYYNRVKPGLVMGVSEDLWSQWEQPLSRAGYALTEALALREKYNSITSKELTGDKMSEPAPAEEEKPARMGTNPSVDQSNAFTIAVKSKMNMLSNWKIVINNDPENSEADKKSAMTWIQSKWSGITTLLQQFNKEGEGLDPAEQAEIQNDRSPGYLESLNRITKDFGTFQSEWVG